MTGTHAPVPVPRPLALIFEEISKKLSRETSRKLLPEEAADAHMKSSPGCGSPSTEFGVDDRVRGETRAAVRAASPVAKAASGTSRRAC